MKGLLIKDWCMLMKHCRFHLLIICVFLLAAIVSGEMFFLFYPCVLAGMFTTTLLAYDEQSKWIQYSATFPYKRSQIVGAKYLLGFILIGITLLLTTGANIIFQMRNGGVDISLLTVTLSTTMLLGFAMPAISLPFMFKLGVQKGRTAYFITIGVIFGGIALASLSLKEGNIPVSVAETLNTVFSQAQYILFPLTVIIVLLLYVLSYVIAAKLYEKKEL